VEADFGFAGMFWSREVGLALTHFRAYDPQLGRWLSRDPLRNAEVKQGPSLYAYVGNEPVSRIDPEGLATIPGLGFNSVTVGLATTCSMNPDECAALAATLEITLPEVEGPVQEGVAVLAENGEALGCALENAVPQLGQTLPSIAPHLGRVAAAADQVAARFAALDESYWFLSTSERWVLATYRATGGRFTLSELWQMWEALFGSTWGEIPYMP
jgi:RHS repeat-associated protein